MKNKTNKIELKDLKIYFPKEKIVKSTEGLHKIKVELNSKVIVENICIEYYVEYFRPINRFVISDKEMKRLEFYVYEDAKLMIEEFALNDMQELLKKIAKN